MLTGLLHHALAACSASFETCLTCPVAAQAKAAYAAPSLLCRTQMATPMNCPAPFNDFNFALFGAQGMGGGGNGAPGEPQPLTAASACQLLVTCLLHNIGSTGASNECLCRAC